MDDDWGYPLNIGNLHWCSDFFPLMKGDAVLIVWKRSAQPPRLAPQSMTVSLSTDWLVKAGKLWGWGEYWNSKWWRLLDISMLEWEFVGFTMISYDLIWVNMNQHDLTGIWWDFWWIYIYIFWDILRLIGCCGSLMQKSDGIVVRFFSVVRIGRTW